MCFFLLQMYRIKEEYIQELESIILFLKISWPVQGLSQGKKRRTRHWFQNKRIEKYNYNNFCFKIFFVFIFLELKNTKFFQDIFSIDNGINNGIRVSIIGKTIRDKTNIISKIYINIWTYKRCLKKTVQ